MLSLIGLGGFTLASLVIGVRLALLTRRTRAWPEAMLAVAFLASGALGNSTTALVAMDVPPEAWVPTLTNAARLLGMTGSSALYLFCWRVYRPDSTWAAMLALTGIGGGVASWAGHGVSHGFGAPLLELAWYWPVLLTRGLGYGWAAIEALVYWRTMRRRQALGLADVMTTHRFLFWGLGATAAFGIFVVNMGHTLAVGAVEAAPWKRDVASCLGLLAAITIWMAFFPPAPYRRWATRSATPAS